jgi:integrase
VYSSVKTGAEVKLPITLLFEGKAYELWKKYKDTLPDFFKLKHNSNVNKDLLKLKKIAKINTHMSFHTARHTNATLLLYKGVNITTVQKLLGHRNILTTQIYGEVMERTLVKDLKKCTKKDKDFLLMEKAVERG